MSCCDDDLDYDPEKYADEVWAPMLRSEMRRLGEGNPDISPYDNDEWDNAAIGRGSTPIEGTDYYLFNKAVAEHLGFVQTRI